MLSSLKVGWIKRSESTNNQNVAERDVPIAYVKITGLKSVRSRIENLELELDA